MDVLQDKLRQIRFIVSDMDGVLTDGGVAFDGDGRPFRTVHARDATGLTLWHLAGGKSALVSGLGSKALEAIAKQWGCAEHHMYVKDKTRVCREMAERHGVSLSEMAFLGDDIIDMRAMEAVGLGVCVADGGDEARAAADIVLQTAGGKGALRELVHLILKAQDRMESVLDAYCSRKDVQHGS